jgi:hypothetical protein
VPLPQVGEAVEAVVTVAKASGRRVAFTTACYGPGGRLLLDGTALAMMPAQAAGTAGTARQ